MAGFSAFLQLPADQKAAWCCWAPPSPPDDPDDLYLNRSVEGGSYDQKQLIMYRPRGPNLLAANGVDVRPHTDWLDACRWLWNYAAAQTRSVIAALDQRLKQAGTLAAQSDLSDEASLQASLSALRLVQYDRPDSTADQLGKRHTDRCDLTLALWEQPCPGLVLHARGGDSPFTVWPGHALVFPGRGLEQRTGGRIQALPHSINVVDAAVHRQAVIFFTQLQSR